MTTFFAKSLNYVFGKVLQKKHISITGSLEFLHRMRDIDYNYFDHIRLSCLELISFEIKRKEIVGNVAELGVYKGKFARFINQFFPERKLYLFDTFEGFDRRDIDKENSLNLSSGEQDFSNTSIAAVLKRIPFPEKCIPVKGFFPESAEVIEDRFVLVSIDADLYQPIYAGLEYFYPRLVRGGYILIHDFNNDNYKGSRQAVEEFCSKNNINFTPLPDAGGSAIICK